MDKFDKFCYRNNHRGVSNLMLFVAVCNVLVYFASMVEPSIIGWLAFNSGLVLSGQIWRIFTFVFIPINTQPLFLLIACYFYFWVGRALEREWGKLKFNIFYLTGMLATALYCWITGALGVAVYLNLSLFFAYATLFAEQRILLFFVIPVKVKYIAIVQAAIYGFMIVAGFGSFPYNLAPLVALLNYFLYFHRECLALFKRGAVQVKKRETFRSAVNQARKRPEYEGHVHRCAVCGLTDTADPNMEFRYCSLCAHYECYCSQHIFTHEHVRQ